MDRIGPGRRPTIADVAALAGVSKATVSYVLAGRSDGGSAGTPNTLAKVRRAADDLGYRPHRAARGARTGRSGTLLTALPELGDPWALAMVEALVDTATAEGLQVLVLPSNDWFDLLASLPMDAAFISRPLSRPEDRRHLDQLISSGARLVVFSDELDAAGFDVVATSPTDAVRLAVRTLAGWGQLGFVSQHDPASNFQGRDRLNAFLDEARSLGVGVDPSRHVVVGGADEVTAFLERGVVDAIVAETVAAAISTLVAANRCGLRLPDDLQLLAIGNVPPTDDLAGRLSWVGVPGLFQTVAGLVVECALVPDRIPTRHVFTNQVVNVDTTRVDRRDRS